MNTVARSVEQLVEQNQGMVYSIAGQIHRRLPSHIELDDLVAYGQVGLAEAARGFDAERGLSFSTYAYYRIRGAIYDGLSKLSWTSRARCNRIRYDGLANETLASDSQGDSQAGGEAGLRRDVRWLGDASEKLFVVFLATHRDGASESVADQLEDRNAKLPDEEVTLRELSRKVRELVDTLPEQAASLIRGAYFEGLSLTEAGERIGVGKSRASRIHAQALQRLARSFKLCGLAD